MGMYKAEGDLHDEEENREANHEEVEPDTPHTPRHHALRRQCTKAGSVDNIAAAHIIFVLVM